MYPGSLTILCVDDDPNFVDLTATFLEQNGDEFTVLTETSASDGLHRLEEEAVDCIVSDYEMPERDGLDFLEAVRADYPDLPFILFTGKGSEDVAEDAIQAGVTCYLQKESGTSHYTVLANRIEHAVSQHRAQRRVSSLEQEYELVAETATDAFWTVDLLTDSTSMSEGIAQFGYDPDTDFARGWFFEQIHPDDRDRIRQLNEAVLACDAEAFDELNADRGTFSSEYRFQRADSTYAYVEDRGIIVFEGGTPVKMVGTMSDVTEREEREQELRQTTQRLEAVLETVPSSVFMWNLDGEVLLLNEYAREVLGLEDEQVRGRSILDIMPDDFAKQVLENQQQALDADGVVKIEEQVSVGDEVRTFMTLTGPVHGDDGEVYATCGIATDITDQTDREQELEQKTERLEKFASILSHDLQSPMSTAKGYLELAQEDCDSGYLAKTDTALGRIESIVDDVLTLARESDITKTEEIPLESVVEGAWRIIEPDEAMLDVSGASRPLSCDHDRLCRALENLFRNAIEHGGDDVTVRVGGLSNDEGFYVEDTGVGLPAGDTTKLFEWGHSRQSDGDGLGLAIVEQIVEAHGWTITATDSDDGGARFEITGVSPAT